MEALRAAAAQLPRGGGGGSVAAHSRAAAGGAASAGASGGRGERPSRSTRTRQPSYAGALRGRAALLTFFLDHFDHPYPSPSDVAALAADTGMSRKEVRGRRSAAAPSPRC